VRAYPTMSNYSKQAAAAQRYPAHPGTGGYTDVPQFLTSPPYPFVAQFDATSCTKSYP
jgi:hypothetical protein